MAVVKVGSAMMDRLKFHLIEGGESGDNGMNIGVLQNPLDSRPCIDTLALIRASTRTKTPEVFLPFRTPSPDYFHRYDA